MKTTPKSRLIGLFFLFALPFCIDSPRYESVVALQDDPPGGVLVDNAQPQWGYVGTANNSAIEWEIGGVFYATWSITEENPEYYYLWWNQTGTNQTYTEGSYSDTISGNYDPALSDVGNIIFFQMWCNDSVGFSNSSIVFFSVTNTNPPTVEINRPENITYATGTVEIWIRSPNLDLALLWWSLYYGNESLMEGNVTWVETVTRELENGQYYLRAFCNDTAGLEDPDGAILYFTIATAVTLINGGSGAEEDMPEAPITVGAVSLQMMLPQLFLSGVFLGSIIYYFGGYNQREESRIDAKFTHFRSQINREMNAISLYWKGKYRKVRKKQRRRQVR